MRDEGKVPVSNGTRPPLQVTSHWVSGPTGLCGNPHTVIPAYHKELFAGGGGLIGILRPPQTGYFMWPHHIDRFEQKYYKAFMGNRFFVAAIVNCIHKWLQVFLK